MSIAASAYLAFFHGSLQVHQYPSLFLSLLCDQEITTKKKKQLGLISPIISIYHTSASLLFIRRPRLLQTSDDGRFILRCDASSAASGGCDSGYGRSRACSSCCRRWSSSRHTCSSTNRYDGHKRDFTRHSGKGPTLLAHHAPFQSLCTSFPRKHRQTEQILIILRYFLLDINHHLKTSYPHALINMPCAVSAPRRASANPDADVNIVNGIVNRAQLLAQS